MTLSDTSSHPLAGTVSKALLVVAPAFAHEREFVQYLKYRLYDAGFIVVREEFRLLNRETVDKLCTDQDVLAVPRPTDSSAAPASEVADDEAKVAAMASGTVPAGLFPCPEDLVGTAYVFVLARANCHTALVSFIAQKLCGEDVELISNVMKEKNREDKELPFWVSRTPRTAKMAVGLLFPRMLAEDIPSSAVSREYVQANLKHALVPALAELAKQKPKDSVRWLAMFLLSHNTQAPPMMSLPH